MKIVSNFTRQVSFPLEAPLANRGLAFFIFTLILLSRSISSFNTNLLTFSKYSDAQSACQVASVVSDSFATLWAVAHQAPLSMGILQARILE